MRRNNLAVIAALASLSLGGIGGAVGPLAEADDEPSPKREPRQARSQRNSGTSVYMPHQGKREIERRLRQQAKQSAAETISNQGNS